MAGIRLLEDIRQRCRVDEVTGCWEWSLCTSWSNLKRKKPKRLPVCYYHPMGKNISVLRLALILSGKRLHDSHRVWRTCGNELCCNPAHMKHGTGAQWGEWLKQTGSAKMDPAHLAACRNASFARAYLTREQAAYVLASPKTGKALAEELGVSTKVISRVRTRKAAYARPAMGSVWALAA